MQGICGERSGQLRQCAELVFWVHEPECATGLVLDKCRFAARQLAGRAARAMRSCEARCCQRHGLRELVVGAVRTEG